MFSVKIQNLAQLAQRVAMLLLFLLRPISSNELWLNLIVGLIMCAGLANGVGFKTY